MLVSIIIPTFNEECFIEKCLMSVSSQKTNKDIYVEVLVIDGGSTDRTVEFIKAISVTHPNIILLFNNNKYQSYALNIGIKSSSGEYIIRLDAHSIYPENYIQSLLDAHQKKDAMNVGGVVSSLPYQDTYSANLVQALTTHRFGIGNSSFRLKSAPGFVDTVPFGCFKREIFDQIGYFDERLVRCQDYEFNRRIAESGGKLWLDPSIQVLYFNQPNLKQFLRKQYLLEAPYNTYMWYIAPYTFAYRHAITGIFTLGLIIGVVLSIILPQLRILMYLVCGLYVLLSVVASIQQAIRYKNIKHILCLPGSFFLFHFVHGLGIIKGIITLILKGAPVQKLKEPWENYGKYRIIVNRIIN